MSRVGFGYDIHALREGLPFILGGVEIPYPCGLEGHSDADVLCHAVADALLGAAALGDIGDHFPDTDPRYRGVSSLMLLSQVQRLLTEKGWQIHNADATVVAEKPKLQPYKLEMRRNLAGVLGTSIDNVSVKATTNEGFGASGRGQAVQVFAVAMITGA